MALPATDCPRHTQTKPTREVAKAVDALAVAQRLRQRGSQCEANVLVGVVVVDPDVAVGVHDDVKQPVRRDLVQHVVQEGDLGAHFGHAGAIQVDLHADLGLLGHPVHSCSAGCGSESTRSSSAGAVRKQVRKQRRWLCAAECTGQQQRGGRSHPGPGSPVVLPFRVWGSAVAITRRTATLGTLRWAEGRLRPAGLWNRAVPQQRAPTPVELLLANMLAMWEQELGADQAENAVLWVPSITKAGPGAKPIFVGKTKGNACRRLLRKAQSV